MTATQLRQEIARYKEKKMATCFLETEYWLRWVLAMAPLFFALVGVPLGMVSERGGKMIGFGMSLVIFFIYYMFLVIGLNLSEKGFIYPGIILWLPDLILLGTAFPLWRKMLRS
jgi:lipopolysaccharide export LptBFGC system permease protein LptF